MSESIKTTPRLVAFGEAVIDMIQQVDGTYQPVPGGSPMNIAVALARQGCEAAIVTPLSTDGFGDMLRRHLQSSNVDMSLATFTEAPTTLAMTTLDFNGEPNFTFYIEGCSQEAWGHEALSKKVRAGDILAIVGSFSLVTEPMSENFDELFIYANSAAQRHTILFDPNIRPVLVTHQLTKAQKKFDSWVSQSTIVKLSSEDLAWRYPDRVPEQVVREWVTEGDVALVVLTLGRGGAFACTKNESVRRLAPEINVIDTVGAGDTFSASLIKWLIDNDSYLPDDIAGLSQKELEEILDYSITLASDTCRREGADAPFADAL